MDIDAFRGPFGRVLQASSGAYFTFEPAILPFEIKYDEELVRLLSEAVLSVGNLRGSGAHLRNPHLLIQPYLRKEAVLSSKIEGTRTSLAELFLQEKEREEPQDPDKQEVLNYVVALEEGLEKIMHSELSEDLIKDLHRTLMRGVRGKDKNPGEYRILQNWIRGADPISARFVPASPQSVPKLMRNLLEYLTNHREAIPLIKAAISHYQFESIHPFRDGNGRIGRLLIVLYLSKSETLPDPLLYLSAYFDKNKDEYNDRLFTVSSEGDLSGWLKFFLKGVKEQADDARIRADKLDEYRESMRILLQTKSRSTNALAVLDLLFANPYIKIPEIEDALNCDYPTAKMQVTILIRHGILREEGARKRNRIFVASRIKEILEI